MTQRKSGFGKWLKLAIGVVISAVMVWWAFRGTSFSDIWTAIIGVKKAPMTLAVVLATLPFPLRVPRWKLLLQREDGSALPSRSLWHATAIGFAANNVLPFRLGEIARMGAVSRLEKVPFASAFSSIAVERVVDALTAVTLLAGGLLLTNLPASSEVTDKAKLTAIFAIVALTAAIVVARWPSLAKRPVEVLVPPGRVREMVLGIIDRLVAGLGALSDPRRAIPVLAWSVLIWSVNAAAFWVAFSAFGIHVPYSGALIVQGMLLVGIALPNSPGYLGAFELPIKLTLMTLFGVPEAIALAYALTYHVLTFIPITLLGVGSLLTTGLTVRTATEVGAQ